MDLAEATRRRGLGLLGAVLVIGSVVLAAFFLRQPDPSKEAHISELRTYDVVGSAPPSIQYEPATMAAPAPPAPPAAPRQIRPVALPQAMPDVPPAAAPGVAFNYRYAFRLPAERISRIQEQHAQACEQLGASRCRITGMHFRVVDDREIEAMLVLKLAPAIARRFGRQASELVTRSDGMLIESEISGLDAAGAIRDAGRDIAGLTEELNRIEARLRQAGLPADERARLDYEAQELRRSIRAQRTNREDQQEILASTPMVFEYASGALVSTPETGPSFERSAARAWDNFLAGIGILFLIIVTLLPWATLALLVWWIFRQLRRRFGWPSGGGLGAAPAEVAAMA